MGWAAAIPYVVGGAATLAGALMGKSGGGGGGANTKPPSYVASSHAWRSPELDPRYQQMFQNAVSHMPGAQGPGLGVMGDQSWQSAMPDVGMTKEAAMQYLAPYASGEMSYAQKAAQAERQSAAAMISGQAGAAGFNPAMQRQALLQMSQLGQNSAASVAAAAAKERADAARAYTQAMQGVDASQVAAHQASTARGQTVANAQAAQYDAQLKRQTALSSQQLNYVKTAEADREIRRQNAISYERELVDASRGTNLKDFNKSLMHSRNTRDDFANYVGDDLLSDWNRGEAYPGSAKWREEAGLPPAPDGIYLPPSGQEGGLPAPYNPEDYSDRNNPPIPSDSPIHDPDYKPYPDGAFDDLPLVPSVDDPNRIETEDGIYWGDGHLPPPLPPKNKYTPVRPGAPIISGVPAPQNKYKPASPPKSALEGLIGPRPNVTPYNPSFRDNTNIKDSDIKVKKYPPILQAYDVARPKKENKYPPILQAYDVERPEKEKKFNQNNFMSGSNRW